MCAPVQMLVSLQPDEPANTEPNGDAYEKANVWHEEKTTCEKEKCSWDEGGRDRHSDGNMLYWQLQLTMSQLHSLEQYICISLYLNNYNSNSYYCLFYPYNYQDTINTNKDTV